MLKYFILLRYLNLTTSPRVCAQLNDGAEANVNEGKPTFPHLPMRLRNPRGVGLAHRGARTPNTAHLPDPQSPKEPEERESVPEDHAKNTIQGDLTVPQFAHIPLNMHDPRGARLSRPMEEATTDPASASHVESANPEVNQVRFSHLPRLHNPRGVNAVKQIQERMTEESDRQVGDDGDKN